MTVQALQYVSKEWVKLESQAKHVSIALKASPPVGASLKLIFYSMVISDDGKWTKDGSVVIDNLAYTDEVFSTTFQVRRGKYYSVMLQGEAHLLMPGYDEINVGVAVHVDGKSIKAFEAPDAIKGSSAGLVGVLYFQVGEKGDH